MESDMERIQIQQLHAVGMNQHGLLSLGQAAGLGISERAMRHAVDRGWIRSVRRGVYAIAGVPPSPWEATMAAALAAGGHAVISHFAAAAIHRFHGISSRLPELTYPGGGGSIMEGVRVHRSQFDPDDVQVRSGVQITTPMRTVIDIAASTDEYLLGRILDDGALRGLWRAEQIAARLDQPVHTGRSGTVRLRRLITPRMGEPSQDSPLEQRVLRVLKGRVPEPVVHYQLVLDDQVIDMDLAWPDDRIDGEIDGMRTHIQRSAFDRDRRRANTLGRYGWRLVHWTSTMDDGAILAQVMPYFATR